ncbi:putative sterol 3-beta-glucosyltransferase [Lupinus albus]|uniref:Putative sterol 3-beta-glucosyltransferase n=1 Tax=Lupinus albus TaxID=3870 RepID=A0A6A4QC65_LUPAL|nr:putative sterol 3-beta-glucosyltransferase [Lupinus albus]
MAELPENRQHSSSSSSDVSVRVEHEVGARNGIASKDVENNGSSVVDNASSSSGVPSKGLSKVTTLPADISHGDKLESSSNTFKWERSKTEKHRHVRPEDAAQIFDDKVPVQEKIRLLNRIATVKDDGTVEFEVPGNLQTEALGVRSKHLDDAIDDSPDAMDQHYIPPLNIVMLIVGTRGDVQPFVAIGKRLQILVLLLHPWLLLNILFLLSLFLFQQ